MSPDIMIIAYNRFQNYPYCYKNTCKQIKLFQKLKHSCCVRIRGPNCTEQKIEKRSSIFDFSSLRRIIQIFQLFIFSQAFRILDRAVLYIPLLRFWRFFRGTDAALTRIYNNNKQTDKV